MFRNYLTIAIRTVRRHTFYSLINISGLALGIATCLLMALFIADELQYDTFHEKAGRIALFRQFENYSASGSPFAGLLRAEMAQVENAVRLVPKKALIQRETQSYYEDHFYFADTSVFSVFTFPLLEGNPANALAAPYSVVISEKMAQKYFPNENPVGKTLDVEGRQPLQITGVLKNLPAYSHLPVDFLCSMASAETLLEYPLNSYWDGQALTYLLLSPGTDISQLRAQLPAVIEKTSDPNAAVWKPALIPLRDIYLRHSMDGRIKAQNALVNVYIFSAVAVFVLILAGFNYVNLATARSLIRAREVGVRKTLGADRRQLLAQFMGEAAFFVIIAGAAALLVAQLVLPAFNALAEKNLSLSTLISPGNAALMLGVLGLISLLTGLYPALVLSSFRPTLILKNITPAGTGKGSFRQVLVVAQFAVSVAMIIATIVVARQLNFIQQKELGYQREQVLTLSFPADASTQQKNTFAQEVSRLANIRSATVCSSLPGNGAGNNKLVTEYVPEGQTEGGIAQVFTDADFVPTFNIRLVEGRNFRPGQPENGFLINEAAMRYFGWESAVGKTIGYYRYEYSPEGGYREVPVRGEIIGVVADYHQSDLKSRITPLMIISNREWAGQVAVSLRAGTISGNLAAIEQSWQTFFPGKPFDYAFLDEAFDQTYKKEARTGRIFGVFAGLAIGISCLGLFGLAAFTAQQRTKEIGIRKVLGASVPAIVGLLARDFLKLVGISVVLAVPLAGYAMNRWLEDFAYRIDIGAGTYILAGIAALLIALLTVSWQSIKAALTNPVKSLRSE